MHGEKLAKVKLGVAGGPGHWGGLGVQCCGWGSSAGEGPECLSLSRSRLRILCNFTACIQSHQLRRRWVAVVAGCCAQPAYRCPRLLAAWRLVVETRRCTLTLHSAPDTTAKPTLSGLPNVSRNTFIPALRRAFYVKQLAGRMGKQAFSSLSSP